MTISGSQSGAVGDSGLDPGGGGRGIYTHRPSSSLSGSPDQVTQAQKSTRGWVSSGEGLVFGLSRGDKALGSDGEERGRDAWGEGEGGEKCVGGESSEVEEREKGEEEVLPQGRKVEQE